MAENDWELSKENIQPRKEGRNISSLMMGLTPMKNNDRVMKLHHEKQQFELALRTNDGPDPLDIWYRYVIWTEQHSPEGSDSEANILKDPTEIFNYMYSQNIGTEHSLFYESWTALLEMSDQFKKAFEVYEIGLARNAQPIERLQRHYREFQKRLVKMTEEYEEEAAVETEESRVSLASLKKKSKGAINEDRIHGRSKQSGGLKISQPSKQKKTVGFTVFCDENPSSSKLPSATGEWKKPPTNTIIVKENKQEAGKWNSGKQIVSKAASQAAQKPGFNIYFDEEEPEKPCETPKQLFITERKPLSSKKIDKKPQHSDPLGKITENVNSKEQVMYRKTDVYMGNQEFSFEELRAARWIKKNGPIIAPITETTNETRYDLTNMVLDATLMNEAVVRNAEKCVEGQHDDDAEMECDKQQEFVAKINKKLKFGERENNADADMPDVCESFKSSKENQLQITPRQPVTSLSTAECFQEDHSDSNLSGFNDFNDYGDEDDNGDDDLMPKKYQSTAVIDLTSLQPDIRRDVSKFNAFNGPDISTIQAINKIEQDPNNISMNDDDGDKDCDVKKMIDIEKGIPDVTFSALDFEIKMGGRKDLKAEKNKGSLSQCLDIPMFLKSNKNDERKEALKMFDGDENDVIHCDGANADESIHHFLQMPNEVIKPKPMKTNAGMMLRFNHNEQKENVPAAVASGLKFKVFEDGNDACYQGDDGDKENAGAFPKVMQVGQRPKNAIPFTIFADDNDDNGGDNVAENTFKDKTVKNIHQGLHQSIQPQSSAANVCEDPAMISGIVPISDDSVVTDVMPPPSKTPLIARSKSQTKDIPFAFSMPTKSPIWAPSPTMHTKKANQDIMDMFNATLDCDKSEFTFQQTEDEKTTRGSFEKKFTNRNSMGCGFEILTDAEQKIPSCISDLENALTTPQPLSIPAAYDYQVKDLSIIPECSDDDRTRSSHCSSTLNSNDRSSNVFPLGCFQNVTSEQTNLNQPSFGTINEVDDNEAQQIGFDNGQSLVHQGKRPDQLSNGSVDNSNHNPLPAPFNTERIEKLVMALDFSEYANFFEFPATKCQKFTANRSFMIGDGCYKILKKIASGGFSEVYLCHYFDQNKAEESPMQIETVLKVMKSEVLCCWEFFISDQLHERIENQQLSPEFHNSLILPERAFLFNDAAVIEYPYYNGKTLLGLVNKWKQENFKVTEQIALAYALEICKIVNTVHDCNIIHGDIKPDNFLFTSDTVIDNIHPLILSDFGRSIDLTVYPTDIKFTGSCNTDQFECIQMKENLPWKYQVDYYGVACTIHVIVFGAYLNPVIINGKYRSTMFLSRKWNRSFWESIFDRLLNIGDCNRQTILSELCTEFEQKLSPDH
eukprot:gene20252-22236_t